ncbi:MAG: carboxyl-terminal processing protease [Rhodospirillaceae bacterium]|nr:MAG: carboxyl-terminal processing protease [Rhodospirillaceae bacterium]
MKRTVILALGVMLALSPTMAGVAGAASQEPQTEKDTYHLLELFGAAFERARRDYVDDVGDQQLIENAINGMLSSLDPHSGYLNAKNYKEMQVQTKGQFGGLGIEVTLDNGWVKVISPIDETPASRAGVQPGDYITHLDGKPVLGLNLNDAVDKMRGPPDSNIRLTIRREGMESFDLTLTRAVIKIQSVKGRVEGEDIGYLRITSFTDRTAATLQQVLQDVKDQTHGKLKGYVLDLRNNPGGLLDQAIAVADVFLNQGEIVSTRSRRTEDIQRYNARKGDLADTLPIVVLINDGSASASEIVAGALQDHRRAILVGTRSFGKGSVQTIIPLHGNGAMRLTTARYYTPSGRSIQAVGIEPDILVEQARLQVVAGNGRPRSEADLRHALTNDTLKSEQGKDETATPSVAPASQPPKDREQPRGEQDKPREKESEIRLGSPEDYQLARAFDLLRGLSLYRVVQMTNSF